jgi:5-formyltetrahydrofolate cyclo-ligase
MSDKQAVRAAALAKRRGMPAATRDAQDEALVESAVRFADDACLIAAYVPMIGEPGGPRLADALAAAVASVLLPVLTPNLDLDWARYDGTLAASESAAARLRSTQPPSAGLPSTGLREPVGPRLGVNAIEGVDLLFVPALAVDRSGMRLGRGGGSYDRALARVPPGIPVVALLYDGELCDGVPAGPHDRHVTAVLTPSGLHQLPASR